MFVPGPHPLSYRRSGADPSPNWLGKTCRGTQRIRRNNPKLRDDISTDEDHGPAHICFFFDENARRISLHRSENAAMKTPIKRRVDVKKGGFVAAVSGKRRGKGSSREQSPYAELCAGIKLVVAEKH